MTLAKIISISSKNVGSIGVFEYVFSPKGGKLVLKGGNGEGKTTAQHIIKLPTGGSTIIDRDYKDEKLLINAFIADGDNRVAVTVKNGKNGLIYTLKGYDSEKKPIGEIDGVKLTAGSYLKMLYDPMITKVAAFCSQDRTIARKCHTELFADKLGKIAIDQLVKDLKDAQDDMQYKERLRNTVADGFRGTDEFLKTKGVDWKRPDTHPLKEFDNSLESKKIEILAEQSRLKSAPEQERTDKMNALESDMKLIAEKAINYNAGIEAELKEQNKELEDFEVEKERVKLKVSSANELINELALIVDKPEPFIKIKSAIREATIFFTEGVFARISIPAKIQYDEKKKIDTSKIDDLTTESETLLSDLTTKRSAYISLANANANPDSKEPIKTPEQDKQLAELALKITAETEQKGLRKALDSFFSWQDARDKVTELKAKIAEKYAAIDTGIDGLEFKYDDEANKTDMHYDGSGFDFFTKLHGKAKRVTELSETERALLCLMVQFKRMSERAKSINLTYIDCSITKKSYQCIEQALEKYGLKDVYVVASQACDITADQLNDCDVLIEGGEVFFNGQNETKAPEQGKDENKQIESKY